MYLGRVDSSVGPAVGEKVIHPIGGGFEGRVHDVRVGVERHRDRAVPEGFHDCASVHALSEQE